MLLIITTMQLTRKEQGVDYPMEYPFDFRSEKLKFFLNNDHYQSCHFVMHIFGQVNNPIVTIDGHPYTIHTDVPTGAYLTIDSRDQTVIETLNDGTVFNKFNARDKEKSVFKKIKPGVSELIWGGEFGINITLYQERGEPKWK